MDDFLLRALLAGVGIAIIAAPLGCFVIWQRMAYFGDTLAHSALLGVALGLWFEVPVIAGMLGVAFLIGLLLVTLQNKLVMAGDTILGILSHTALALGLIVLSLLQPSSLDLTRYLFGDILTASEQDIWTITLCGTLVMVAMTRLWKPLLLVTLHPELAAAEGLRVTQLRLVYVVMLALVIALAMQLVGILLITALLILPAAAGRQLASTPESMVVAALLIGVNGVGLGVYGSLYVNAPTGPMIIVSLAGLFALSLLFKQIRA